MSSNPNQYVLPKIGKKTFIVRPTNYRKDLVYCESIDDSQGLVWGGVIVTALFCAFRIYVRLKSFRRLFADDALVLVSWLLLASTAIIWQSEKDMLYTGMAVAAGQLPPPNNYPSDHVRHLRSSAVAVVFFVTGLWSVKLSFLIFFRRLGQNVKGQKILWWTVLAVTAASYIVVICSIYYRCLVSSFEYITSKEEFDSTLFDIVSPFFSTLCYARFQKTRES